MLLLLSSLVDSQEEKEKVEAIFHEYQGLMYSVAYGILQHEQNAEDAVFHSWEKIICHLDRIPVIKSKQTKSFLVIIVERTAIDMYRRLKRHREIPLEFEDSIFYAVNDAALEKIDTIEWIHSLPKKYAEVLLLYYIHDCTLLEIADLLGIQESSVIRRLQKGRNFLGLTWKP